MLIVDCWWWIKLLQACEEGGAFTEDAGAAVDDLVCEAVLVDEVPREELDKVGVFRVQKTSVCPVRWSSGAASPSMAAHQCV